MPFTDGGFCCCCLLLLLLLLLLFAAAAVCCCCCCCCCLLLLPQLVLHRAKPGGRHAEPLCPPKERFRGHEDEVSLGAQGGIEMAEVEKGC